MSPHAYTLLAALAHPDDEAFGIGGTLAKYAAEGMNVYVVTATRGEAGSIAEPDLATASSLPDIRERELRCACEVYGIHPPRLLDYVDGQLPIVHQGQAVAKLVRVIRELRPQVLVTFGPDGIYGHYDHIAVHRWASIAYELAADPDCFPGRIDPTCAPHQVSKLYYHVLTEQHVDSLGEGQRPAAVQMDGVPFRFLSYQGERITTVIDIRPYAEIKLRGIRCHATQVGRNSRFGPGTAVSTAAPWTQTETFILAQSTLDRPEGIETDLFAGMR